MIDVIIADLQFLPVANTFLVCYLVCILFINLEPARKQDTDIFWKLTKKDLFSTHTLALCVDQALDKSCWILKEKFLFFIFHSVNNSSLSQRGWIVYCWAHEASSHQLSQHVVVVLEQQVVLNDWFGLTTKCFTFFPFFFSSVFPSIFSWELSIPCWLEFSFLFFPAPSIVSFFLCVLFWQWCRSHLLFRPSPY